MFPETSTSAITQAISNAQNLQGAIDRLLAANRRDIRGIYHLLKLFKVTLFQKYIVYIFQFLSTFLVPLRALHFVTLMSTLVWLIEWIAKFNSIYFLEITFNLQACIWFFFITRNFFLALFLGYGNMCWWIWSKGNKKETEIKLIHMLLSWLEIICGSHSFVSLTITDGKHMIAELTG